TAEIIYLQDRLFKTEEEVAAGKQPKVNISNVRHRIDDLEQRLNRRKRELLHQRNLVSTPPRVISCTLVIPGELNDAPQELGQIDAAAKARIKKLARDMSADNCGWDITSRPPIENDLMPNDIHIEVKGRQYGQTTVTVSRNEVITGLNQGERYYLAIALI